MTLWKVLPIGAVVITFVIVLGALALWWSKRGHRQITIFSQSVSKEAMLLSVVGGTLGGVVSGILSGLVILFISTNQNDNELAVTKAETEKNDVKYFMSFPVNLCTEWMDIKPHLMDGTVGGRFAGELQPLPISAWPISIDQSDRVRLRKETEKLSDALSSSIFIEYTIFRDGIAEEIPLYVNTPKDQMAEKRARFDRQAKLLAVAADEYCEDIGKIAQRT